MNRRDALVAGLLAATLVAFLVPFAWLGIDWHHDGIMLKPALDVLSGQVLFRDTFMQYGALTCYLQVVALWFQPSLLALRFMTVAAYGVTLFFLYASWRLILPRSLTILASGLFILFIPCYEQDWLHQYWKLLPWSSVFAMMFQSIGVYALFRVIQGERPERWGLVLGVACAGVFWCRQPVGVTICGAVALIWLVLHWTNWTPAGQSKRSILVRIAGGFLAVSALLLADISVSGALPEWWYQNFVWPRKWALETMTHSFGGYLDFFVHPAAGAGLLLILLAAASPVLVKKLRPAPSSRGLLAYFLCLGLVVAWQHERVLQVLALRDGGWSALFPFLVLLQAVISVALAVATRGRSKTSEYYLVAALTTLSLASLLQYYPIPDAWHIVWSLAPAFGLVVFVIWRWVGWPAPVVAVLLTALLLPAVYVKAQLTTKALDQPVVTLVNPPVLRGMKVPPEGARKIGQITEFIAQILRHRPDIPSALIGDDAMYLCFTTNRTNPSPYFVTWKRLADDEANEKRWSKILGVRPLMFFSRAKWDAVNDFYRRSRYVPLLYVDAEALEIAVPQEVADAMGVTVYGAPLKGGAPKETMKP